MGSKESGRRPESPEGVPEEVMQRLAQLWPRPVRVWRAAGCAGPLVGPR